MRRLSLPRRGLLLAAAVLLALGAAFLLWFRDSPLVAVEQVTISGTTGPDAPKIESALRAAARDMTTLHVRADELRAAVARYPTVGDVRTDAGFPHALHVEVVERAPVAVVGRGDSAVPVTAGGLVLRGATAGDDLPALPLEGGAGARVTDRKARRMLLMLGAAPRPLLRRTERVFAGPRGLMLALDEGPELWFGPPTDLRAKWAAAARVLADPSSQGADYVDVRVPERAAAGGVAPPPAAAPEAEGTTPALPVPETAPAPAPQPPAAAPVP